MGAGRPGGERGRPGDALGAGRAVDPFESGDDSPQFRSAARRLLGAARPRARRARRGRVARGRAGRAAASGATRPPSTAPRVIVTPDELREFARRLREVWRSTSVLTRPPSARGAPPRACRVPRDAARRPQPKTRRKRRCLIRVIEQYARLMVDTCLDVQPGWQVIVVGGVSARPLDRGGPTARAAGRLCAAAAALRRQLHLRDRLGARGAARTAREPVADRGRHDARAGSTRWSAIDAAENTRALRRCSEERLNAMQTGIRPRMERMFTGDLHWVGGQFPTPALAQDAGMSTDAFADFLFGAVLRDWDAERERMSRYAELFEAAERGAHRRRRDRPDAVDRGAEVQRRCGRREPSRRRVLHLAGRGLGGGRDHVRRVPGRVPGPRGARRSGCASRAAASSTRRRRASEEFLLSTLDTDEGARRLGELGIGCNPGITRHMKNMLFDEKMDGTVHLAVGNSAPRRGRRERERHPLGHRQGPALGRPHRA